MMEAENGMMISSQRNAKVCWQIVKREGAWNDFLLYILEHDPPYIMILDLQPPEL